LIISYIFLKGGSYDIAPSTLNQVGNLFGKYGFPLVINRNIISKDDTTLFVCSGMQNVKEHFHNPDFTKDGSLQSCIRTNDLDLIGDGQHLSYFEMLGNFSFGDNNYETSIEMWHNILSDLKIKIDCVHVYPSRYDHRILWEKRNYLVVDDLECVWFDGGKIGGNCCELYCGSLEIGNLVNSNEHSTDVGFGFERLIQLIENKKTIQETSLFQQNIHPIVSDHIRTLQVFYENGIIPGNKGRNYVCRRLLRRILRYTKTIPDMVFEEWINKELELRNKKIKTASRMWKRHGDKSPSWWWDTFGILPEELDLIK